MRKRMSVVSLRALLGISVAIAGLTGCSSAGYYWQGFKGQMQILQAARPIDDWLADAKTLPPLRQRLEAAQPPPSQPKSIVVVGWTGPTADLVVRRAAWQCGRMRGSARHAGRQPASAGVACAGMWCAQNDA